MKINTHQDFHITTAQRSHKQNDWRPQKHLPTSFEHHTNDKQTFNKTQQENLLTARGFKFISANSDQKICYVSIEFDWQWLLCQYCHDVNARTAVYFVHQIMNSEFVYDSCTWTLFTASNDEESKSKSI